MPMNSKSRAKVTHSFMNNKYSALRCYGNKEYSRKNTNHWWQKKNYNLNNLSFFMLLWLWYSMVFCWFIHNKTLELSYHFLCRQAFYSRQHLYKQNKTECEYERKLDVKSNLFIFCSQLQIELSNYEATMR